MLIAVAVVEHAGCYLIGKRPQSTSLAGLWEFPGGKVHDGETPRAAAARECLEETGLMIDVGEALSPLHHRYAHGEVELHFFHCTLRDASCAPAARFRWVPGVELNKFEFPAANAPLIAELVDRSTRAVPRDCQGD
jgi:mutator protein MutT